MPQPLSRDEIDSDEEPRILFQQFGCEIAQISPGVVLKWGSKVRPSEAEAMRLVRKYAPSVPVPELYDSWFGLVGKNSKNLFIGGQLYMSFVSGVCLNTLWDSLLDPAKERICHQIWGLVAEIRTVPRPVHLQGVFCCPADGSPSLDPLLGDYNDPTPPIYDDTTIRNRIFDRYVRHNGLSYADGESVINLLPRSNKSVFTHGDIGPRNIMVDKNGQILGLIDWEHAGWYPEYWEFVSIMRPSSDRDWQSWMERTSPVAWDITGIDKARRVLF